MIVRPLASHLAHHENVKDYYLSLTLQRQEYLQELSRKSGGDYNILSFNEAQKKKEEAEE